MPSKKGAYGSKVAKPRPKIKQGRGAPGAQKTRPTQFNKFKDPGAVQRAMKKEAIRRAKKK